MSLRRFFSLAGSSISLLSIPLDSSTSAIVESVKRTGTDALFNTVSETKDEISSDMASLSSLSLVLSS